MKHFWLILLLATLAQAAPKEKAAKAVKAKEPGTWFQYSDRCFACHNSIYTPSGEDVSIAPLWRASMMANSSRDPYWQAGVRRESMDHPGSAKHIEDECAKCHMPASRYEAKLNGQEGQVFAHLPFDLDNPASKLAAEGVTCSVCHQIEKTNFGERSSFVGGFKVDPETPPGKRVAYGPYKIEAGHARVMNSSSTFKPTESAHIRQSELCATCHTLITHTLGPKGESLGEFPEQMPYQEWLHSDFKETKSCQACHMPVIQEETPITRVFGEPRKDSARHIFIGGNFFMQKMLSRYRGELKVSALAAELDAAAARTVQHLQNETVKVSIEKVEQRDGRVRAEIAVANLGGHKLPTGYPARRLWLHVTVRDAAGKLVFESGKPKADGSIAGNDHDETDTGYEPHYREITQAGQVQIYESVMLDAQSQPTTGLLKAFRYGKDNRLLPKGFNKATADKEIAPVGDAFGDPDFTGQGDRIVYSVAVPDTAAAYRVEAELWFQPIGYRWAANLRAYDAEETKRFTRFYDSMSSGSALRLATASR